MSANLTTHKIEFSVFGRGYDDDRGNSGGGNVQDSFDLPFTGYNAVFDETGQYCWIYVPGNGTYRQILKLDTSDFSEVEQTTIIPARADDNTLIHPVNTDNNIGILIRKTGFETRDVIIFDLTTDEILVQNTTQVSVEQYLNYECVVVGNTAYFSKWGQYASVFAIDLETASMTVYSTLEGLMGAGGFIDDNTLFYNRVVQWFGDYEGLGGASYSFVNQWWYESDTPGGGTLPNISYDAICGNGYLYLPSYVNGKWGIGKYNGNASSDFKTPKPISFFGDTGEKIQFIDRPVYSNGKEYACMNTRQGIYVTDFETLTRLADTANFERAIGMNDRYIMITHYGSEELTTVYQFN